MKKSMIIQAITVLIAVLFLLNGASFAEEFKNYSYPEQGFSASFPSDWTITKTKEGCEAASKDIIGSVAISNEGEMGAPLEDFFKIYRVEIKKQFPRDYKEIKVEDLTVGGYKAKLLAFSTIESGILVKGYFYLVDVKGKFFHIMMVTNNISEPQALPIFKKILTSIKFN